MKFKIYKGNYERNNEKDENDILDFIFLNVMNSSYMFKYCQI